VITTEFLCQLFPKAVPIPPEQKLISPIHQMTWRVDGELRARSGQTKTVLSPVCVRQADGTLRQLEIGSCPVMGGAEGDEALGGVEHKSKFINTRFIF